MNDTEKRQNQDPITGKFLFGNKAAVKPSAYHFLAKGKMPKIRGVTRIKKEMQRIREELEKAVSPLDIKKEILISQIIRAESYCSLFNEFCKKTGLFSCKGGQVDFAPGAKTFVTLQNLIRHCLRQLSDNENQSKIKPIYDIQEILDQEEKKHEHQNNR